MSAHLLPSDPRWPRIDALAGLLALLANAVPIHAAEYLSLASPARRAYFYGQVALTELAVRAELQKELDDHARR